MEEKTILDEFLNYFGLKRKTKVKKKEIQTEPKPEKEIEIEKKKTERKPKTIGSHLFRRR